MVVKTLAALKVTGKRPRLAGMVKFYMKQILEKKRKMNHPNTEHGSRSKNTHIEEDQKRKEALRRK